MKKRILIISALAMSLVLSLNMSAQDKWKFTEASELTLVGKLFPDTPVPYHRLDTLVYHDGFTSSERHQVTMSSGVSVAFRTNSPKISVCPTYGRISGLGTTGAISQKGFDLYVKDGKEWKWAGSTTAGRSGENKLILNNNEKGMLECLLYLPLVSSVDALKIGVEDGYDIQPAENPFRHRIAIFGSSYTHGISTSRPGMAYPAQLSRMTGLQFLSLGCSGNSKLQDYFARALADADVDAYVFDAFSNPSPAMIKERLFKFIEIIQEKHPDTPLIFQKTIYRERRNYDAANDLMIRTPTLGQRSCQDGDGREHDASGLLDVQERLLCGNDKCDGSGPRDFSRWHPSGRLRLSALGEVCRQANLQDTCKIWDTLQIAIFCKGSL